MSFSKRKQQHYQQRQYLKKQSQYQNNSGSNATPNTNGGGGASNSTASISSSYSSHSLKSPSQPPASSSTTTTAAASGATLDMTVQSGMIPTSPSSIFSAVGGEPPESAKNSPASIFNMISSNTQRLFSFQQSPTSTNVANTSSSSSSRMPTSLESDSDLYNKLGNDDDVVIGTGTRKHQLKLDLNDDVDALQQSDFIVTPNRPPSNLESPVGTVSDLIKTKV